jgi:hypothetical protein
VSWNTLARAQGGMPLIQTSRVRAVADPATTIARIVREGRSRRICTLKSPILEMKGLCHSGFAAPWDAMALPGKVCARCGRRPRSDAARVRNIPAPLSVFLRTSGLAVARLILIRTR